MLKTLRIAVIASLLAFMLPAYSSVIEGCNHVGHAHGMHVGDNGFGYADFTYFPTPTAWDPGAGTSRIGGYPNPGGATYSIMNTAGLFDASGFPDGGHDGATQLITALGVAGFTVADYGTMVGAALDIWASVSGFTNLGQVADSGNAPGTDGAVGDIRVAAWDIVQAGVLAHNYQPGDESLTPGGNILGDMHIDTDWNWVDDAADVGGNGMFDLFTVVLHELGHALGLGHSADINAVMAPFYGGANRTLGADDIAGIQSIYGALQQDVPEPGTLWLLGMGLLGLGWSRRRSV